MRIRDATAADVDAILPLVERINRLHQDWDPARFTLKENILPGYRRWMASKLADPRSVLLVAETETPGESKIVAYLVGEPMSEVPIYWLPECGWIHDIWVEPDYRNEGLGRQLVMHAVEKFRALGLPQVRLQTAAANESGRAMFAQCGFRPATVEMICELAPPPGGKGGNSQGGPR